MNTPPGLAALQGVTVVRRHDAWAVGYNDAGPVYTSLILHWNGQRWNAVPSPNPTGQTNLWAVSASSRTNAWAVGYTNPNGCYAAPPRSTGTASGGPRYPPPTRRPAQSTHCSAS